MSVLRLVVTPQTGQTLLVGFPMGPGWVKAVGPGKLRWLIGIMAEAAWLELVGNCPGKIGPAA